MERGSSPRSRDTYYGGKRRWLETVWSRFGDPDVYIEPFAGSCAILLGKPSGPARREVIADLNGFVCNFWRAIRDDPDLVAHHADWPTVHQDLTARHQWLVRWGREHGQQLSEDPDWYDAKAAGWWAWGASLWIGHGWCIDRQGFGGRPKVQPTAGGQGVSAQSVVLDKVPLMPSHASGPGVSHQRVPDTIPYLGAHIGGRIKEPGIEEKRPRIFGKATGGVGVSTQRDTIPRIQARADSESRPGNLNKSRVRAERLQPWFRALAERLHAVIVLNRTWQSALTPTVMSDTPSSPNVARAIFLDPPYLPTERKPRLYATDIQDPEATAARESFEWAIAHGDHPAYRIAYCCTDGDFEFPDTWEKVIGTMGGTARARCSKKNPLLC